MKASNNAWKEYLELVKERPEEFAPSSSMEIVLDEESVAEFERNTGMQIGVAYRSPYHILVVDLVRDAPGHLIAYERLIPASVGKSVVAIPLYGEKLVLLKQYRHALRGYQIAFPRGFGEDGLTAVENAEKELREEIGATVVEARSLGRVVANSGISGDKAEVVFCKVSEFEVKPGYEGISEAICLSSDELCELIANEGIDDGFTLSAWALLLCSPNYEKVIAGPR